jgi:hypothetical protein
MAHSALVSEMYTELWKARPWLSHTVDIGSFVAHTIVVFGAHS